MKRNNCDPHTISYQNSSINKILLYPVDFIVDIDVPCRKPCSKPAVERILEFGRELYSMSQKLNIDKRSSEKNGKMLEVSVKF